jgi:hypothetical protein
MFSSIDTPGCVVSVSGYLGTPTNCPGLPTHAGLVFFESPRPAVWLVFVCTAHRGQVIAARPLLDRDRAELEHRRGAQRNALAGRAPYARLEPLALGTQARRLVEQARVWAARTQS